MTIHKLFEHIVGNLRYFLEIYALVMYVFNSAYVDNI